MTDISIKDRSLVKNIVIFDLDYTLTKRGTWGRFVASCVKSRPWIWLPLLISAGLAQLKYKRGKAERVTVKQAMIRTALSGMSRTDLQKRARDFSDQEIETGLRPGGVEALAFHRRQNDTIIIASAAADVIVKEICERLEIKHWIATEMGWDENDRLVPEFSTPNCYGAEKVTRIKRLFEQNPYITECCKNITMYSDSYSDLAILCFADVGIAVNPDRRLRAYADSQNMKIVDWTV